MIVDVNLRQLHGTARKLERIRAKALPHATRDALNDMAFQARTTWQRRMGEQMTLRNQYTTRSVMVTKARGANMRAMHSVVGSPRPYLLTQEDGGSQSSKGRHGVTIPTGTASGEGMRANPRKRLVRRQNWLSAIRLGNRGGGSTKQKNAIAISMAQRSGQKVAFLDLGKRKGIVKVTGKGRRTKVRMLWDMSKKSVRIPSNPMLGPTMQAIRMRGPDIAAKHAQAQIDRALR